MMALGTACAWTNRRRRAAVWGFCTRLDRTATATADWKPFTVGNLGMALSWYSKQELFRRCPEYDTLEEDDRSEAAALAEEVGFDVFDGGVAEPAGDVWRAGRELHAHAAGRPAGGEPVAEDGRGGLALIVPQGGSPLGRVGSHLVGSGLIHGPVGTNQQHVARGEHRGQR